MKRKPAAKAGNPPKSRAKVAKGKTAKVAKPTLEEISDADRQRLTEEYGKKYERALPIKKSAAADVANILKKAAEKGITKRDIEIWMQFDEEDGEAELKSDIEQILRIAKYKDSQIGSQIDMGFPKQTADERAFESGKSAAIRNLPRRAPLHLSNRAAQRWMEGHAAGTEINNAALENSFGGTGGFKKLGDAAPPIGDQEATHQEAA